jgi:hypothetical protein
MISSRFAANNRMLAIFLLFGLAICPALRANTLDSSIISMFPKDVRELKYADLSGSRQFAWFPQFQAQLVPDAVLGFEQFLEAAQVQQTPSVDQVAWAHVSISGSAQLVAVGAGQFDIEAIKLFLDSRGISSIPFGSYEIYASQTDFGMTEGYFSLIDNATVAFGPLEGLRRILEIRAGKEGNLSGNAKLMNLIREVNGQAVFWSVLDSAQAGTAVQQLVPEMMKFPQANDLVGKLKQLLISVRASDDIQLDFKADSGSPGDAIVLSQLLEASMLSKRYQSGQDHPDLAKVLDGMVITPFGNQLDIWLTVTDDQMQSLADQNTFSLLR